MASGTASWTLREFFEYRGDRVAYDVFGEGPPIVLVHGTPFSSYVWRGIAPTLAKNHGIHVFDLLGTGRRRSGRGRTFSFTPRVSCWPGSWSTGNWNAP